MERKATIQRKTGETDIYLELDLDGSGKADIDTGIGFFDHMLNAFARHGLFDLTVKVKGDLEVDTHHSVEDTGIVLGKAIAEAVGDKVGIRRFGSFTLPMDEALVLCSLDLSGRAYFAMDANLPAATLGIFETETVREFFISVANSAGMNLHLLQFSGENTHHIIEAMFKAFAKALDQATSIDERITEVLSTKGTL